MQEIPDWHCPGELIFISLSMYSYGLRLFFQLATRWHEGASDGLLQFLSIQLSSLLDPKIILKKCENVNKLKQMRVFVGSPFSANSTSLFLCVPSRDWPMPRQQSSWSGTVPMLSPLLPPPRNGSSSVASCLVDSPSCCGSAPSSASWPTPSRQPLRTILQETMWATHTHMHTHIHIWPIYTSLTHSSHLWLWSTGINNT